jgi:spore coat-associated protein N
MGSVPVSRLLTLAAIGAVVAVCANVVLAQPERSQPYAVLTNASGDLSIWNSLDGQAVFQFSGLAPGRSVSGTVALRNTGSLPGDLGLQQLGVTDQPGVNGGRLSEAVQLDITDITSGSSIPVFAGKIGALASQPLGAIGPGEGRTFQFRASLPDGGAPPSPTGGDNAYAGSGISMRYLWTATNSGSIGGSGGSGGGGGAGGGGGGGNPSTPPKVTKFRVDKRHLQRKGWLDVYLTCDRACSWTISAQGIKSSKGVKFKKARVTMPVANKSARVRMKLTKKGRRVLKKVLRRKTRKPFYLQVKLSTVVEGKTFAFKKKAKLTRATAKKTRKRR